MIDAPVFENESIEKMRMAARAAGIEITTEVVDDRYYIHFDGEGANNDLWSVYWTSLSMYIKFLLLTHGFKCTDITKQTEYHAVVYVGTLFDMLTKEK